MKNRILALLLVVVSLVLTLTGCAYNYEKKDLTEYATFKFDDFKAALQSIEVEDSDFTVDETTRQEKVAEEIYKRLVKTLDAEDKVAEGTVAESDVLYYCYYLVATFEEGTGDAKTEKTYTFYAANMNANSFTTLTLNQTEDGINLDIQKAVIGYDFATKGAYTTVTSGAAEGGKVAYVTYKYQAAGSTSTVSYTNERIELPVLADGVAASTFAEHLVGKTVGSKLKGDNNQNLTLTIDGNVYSEITINWVVSGGEEIVVSPEKNPITSTGTTTSTDGTSKKLADAKKVVYHIFPVARQDVPEINVDNAKLILTNLYGDAIVADALDCFKKDSGWKYTTEDDKERTLNAILEELVKAYDDLEKAEENLKKDKENADLKQKVEDAKKKVDDAALTKVWEEIQKCKKDGEEKSVVEVIVEEYKETIYDTLEETYNKEIKDKVAKELWALIDKSVTVTSTPKSAVKEAYKQNLEAYKYEFYTGKVSTSSNAQTNQEFYGTVRTYLIAVAQDAAEELGKTKPADGDYNAAVEVLKAEAEEQVKSIIKVWTVVKAMAADNEELDLSVSKTEIENFAYQQYLYMYLYYGVATSQDQIIEQYGESNIRTALAFDKLMNHLTETQADDEETKDVDESDASKFLNIQITRKPKAEPEDK